MINPGAQELARLRDALTAIGITPVHRPSTPYTLRIGLGSGVDCVIGFREHEGHRHLAAYALLGTDCRTEPARLRAVLASQEGIVGAKLTIAPNGQAWAAIEFATFDDLDLRYALFSLANAVCGWQHEVLDRFQATAPEPHALASELAMAWAPHELIDVDPAELTALVAAWLRNFDGDIVADEDGFHLFAGTADRVDVVVAPDGVDVTVSALVAEVPDPYSAALGELLRRNGEVQLARIALDEIAGTVSVERTILSPHLRRDVLRSAVTSACEVADHLRDEVMVRGAPLGQYRTSDPVDRVALLEAFAGVTQEWAWRSSGDHADRAADTLVAVTRELDALAGAA